ncbi:LacI family DNA-binding transcriptional regulator [Micromonospora sp. Llam7]|uniref:LacI family DNA-binding transcriptional regulator n=1 Tax=Micromonospora tarapacensis TaxID=2835305 RepID=UPI001C82FA4C|nr:LacI family DNA-binding transcriptional regulator [Micromonospora tarapacensis]MBX7267336.1 LacI family DNA-binding transcriptional regulator [Micromonospora tarapacensis]
MAENGSSTTLGATTIATIAQEVGVSTATVSKVLNGRSDVAAGTRARVEASLERHRYRRRARRASAEGQIDLVFHEFGSDWALEIIRGVEAVTTLKEVNVLLSQLSGARRPPQSWIDSVIARRPLGVLLVMCNLTDQQRQHLQRQSIPVVVVDTDSASAASVPTVGSNNWNGGLLATRHLLELGHRRIAIISGPQDVLCARARTAGFRCAHEELGIPADPGLIRHGNFHLDAGYTHGVELLSRPDRPTAIFAGSDLQAMGVLRAARQVGLDVPGDVSVVGYDNLPVSAWIGPALTTVNQPLRDMAGTATQMLLDLARGNALPTSRIDLVAELVIRESTAPPPHP